MRILTFRDIDYAFTEQQITKSCGVTQAPSLLTATLRICALELEQVPGGIFVPPVQQRLGRSPAQEENLDTMHLQKKHAALPTLVSLILLFPSLCWACDFSYMPSSELYEKASAIFVGKVVESPWKRTVDGTISITGRQSVRFAVQRMFRGVVGAEVTISEFSDCTYPFLDGETYLVHAFQRNGKLDT